MTTARRRSAPAIVGDLLLWVAAIGGAVCVVLAVAAWSFGVSLVMFKTGSMAPTIPAGSVAVVQEIAASEVRVGDVVTVERAGRLPITHRVTAIEGAGATRTITMRGDANPVEDPQPYVVERVRRVVFSVPGLASALSRLQNPLVLGGVTVLASALVTWMFWPRSGGRRRATPGRSASAAGAVLMLAATAALVPAGPVQAAWTDRALGAAQFTALTPQPVPAVACGSGSGLLGVAIPVNWTAPPGRAPTSYRVVWTTAGQTSNKIVTGTSTTIPGGILQLASATTVRVVARYGVWEAPASAETVTLRATAVLGVIVSWTCS